MNAQSPAAAVAAPAPEDDPEGELATAVAQAFAAAGPLAQSDAGYVEREVQQRFAEAVAVAVARRSALVAEVGTGVGKTFAYLVPLLLSGRRALVSTATKSLQDQLYLRDLPRLWDDEPGSRRALAEALFERVEVLGLRQMWIEPTPSAIAAGLVEAFSRASAGCGRGERVGADTKYRSLLIPVANGPSRVNRIEDTA